MASFNSAEMAAHERMMRQEQQGDGNPPAKRMHAVWRAILWLSAINVLLFWGLSSIIAAV